MSRLNRKYPWKMHRTDIPKALLHSFSTLRSIMPKKIDLRARCPPITDQGNLGSCTANAIGANYQFIFMKQQAAKKKRGTFTPSRLFIYYNTRVIEGSVNQDSGAYISNGMKTVNITGTCSESQWPYIINRFALRPLQLCYNIAKRNRTIQYRALPQNLQQMKQCLVNGYPFVFGFLVYASFESSNVARTGYVPMPKRGEFLLGGHAVMCVGFDDARKVFICRNSWGTSWGDKGYFYMPYIYLTNFNLSSDFWFILNITGS